MEGKGDIVAPEGINLSAKSITELKALAYDLGMEMQKMRMDMEMIQAEIKKKS